MIQKKKKNHQVHLLTNKLWFLFKESEPWLPARPDPAKHVLVHRLVKQTIHLLLHRQAFSWKLSTNVVLLGSQNHRPHPWESGVLLKTQLQLLTDKINQLITSNCLFLRQRILVYYLTIYLLITAGFAPSSFLLAKFTFCKGYQLISLVFMFCTHVPPFFSCFSSKFCKRNEMRMFSLSTLHLSNTDSSDMFLCSRCDGYLPVQWGFLHKHIHGVKQKVWLRPVGPQGVNHDALDQTRLLQGLHEVHKLAGQPKRHELRHREELWRNVAHNIYL